MACVYLEALGDNRLIVKATNLDIGLEMELKIKTIEKGIVAVPASVLLGALTSLKENNLTLESKENNLKIHSGKNSMVIKCLPHDDFPSIPKLKMKNNKNKFTRFNIWI